MRNILLIGGMGSGKSTLAVRLLRENPNANYIYMSKFNVRIPMALIATTHPQLLKLPKEEYFETIQKNQCIEWLPFTRQQMDDFGRKIIQTYGETTLAELGEYVINPDCQNILDNLPGVRNVQYLKDKGFFIVGLNCSSETQLSRRKSARKNIDPTLSSDLEKQINATNAYFEISETLKLADITYDTDTLRKTEYTRIAREILEKTR